MTPNCTKGTYRPGINHTEPNGGTDLNVVFRKEMLRRRADFGKRV